jgi:hypothetical protein
MYLDQSSQGKPVIPRLDRGIQSSANLDCPIKSGNDKAIFEFPAKPTKCVTWKWTNLDNWDKNGFPGY